MCVNIPRKGWVDSINICDILNIHVAEEALRIAHWLYPFWSYVSFAQGL